jgi:DNA repair exonuclease SbcCD nuclease subunit
MERKVKMRFIHTSDWEINHRGNDFATNPVAKETKYKIMCKKFSDFIDGLKKLHPDVLLFSGDMWEGPRLEQDILSSSQEIAKKLHELKDAGVKIFWAIGSHDDRAMSYLKNLQRGDLCENLQTACAKVFREPEGEVYEDEAFIIAGFGKLGGDYEKKNKEVKNKYTRGIKTWAEKIKDDKRFRILLSPSETHVSWDAETTGYEFVEKGNPPGYDFIALGGWEEQRRITYVYVKKVPTIPVSIQGNPFRVDKQPDDRQPLFKVKDDINKEEDKLKKKFEEILRKNEILFESELKKMPFKVFIEEYPVVYGEVMEGNQVKLQFVFPSELPELLSQVPSKQP